MPVNVKSILSSGKNHRIKQWRSKSVCRHHHPPAHIKKTLKCIKYTIYYYGKEYIIGADMVEWSRALDIRLSDWCCSVSMV
jgi:hypothetical protein